MAQGVEVLATKPVRVSPTPGPHMVEEETESLKLSSDLHVCAMSQVYGTHTDKCNKIF